MNDEPFIGKPARVLKRSGGKLAARFRSMNILLFAAAFCIMAAVMTVLLNSVVARIATEYAGQYAASSANALSVHIERELGLLTMVARSEAVIDWMANEDDEYKKDTAVSKMVDIVSELYSYNLYVVIENSHNHYRIWTDYVTGNINEIGVVDRSDPIDQWYFTSLESDEDYIMSIGIDHELQRKRVWLDYKVEKDGVPIGVVSTGLEFSHMAGELFSQYEGGTMRGLIVDSDGIVQMDSSLMSNPEYLYSDYAPKINAILTNSDILAVIEAYLDGGAGNADAKGEPVIARISSGPYSIVTITPISSSDWALVILTSGTSLFDVSYFIPILGTALLLLLIIAFVTSAANYRLIFLPLGKLNRSLASLRQSFEGGISGTERDDELGELSRTIQDLFVKANIDVLTGIYNRRFMENNLEHIMAVLSRSNGLLSILMLDIDFFKKYNDAFGHDQGDECLRQIAQTLSDSVTRVSDFTARYGGEEFLAVLINTDEAGMRVVAERLLDRIQMLEIPHPGNTAAPCVTVSIGGTCGRVVYGQKWEEYVKRADEALYMSKNNGRNQFTYLDMQ